MKYRHRGIDADMLQPCRHAMLKVRGDFGAEPRGSNGEDDHAHLLVTYSADCDCTDAYEQAHERADLAVAGGSPNRESVNKARPFPVPSYLAVFCGGVPQEIPNDTQQKRRLL